ncbi:GntR family transcriptional regulator [Streptomyces sp. NBC_00250]|uniref:GntR family transcriptional regulator n=1 Tax=Streptomyces sp. NBC_00250 TaxID=2903641 RepID=UPI002E27DE61|nr:GntR family transcriptional regulator [Streptomyces sp. NBC_00250]
MSADARYRRIAADIHARIQAGEWMPGDMLPSRSAMATQYSVHEQTLRLAYVLLRQTGILEGEQRRGVYVAHPPAMRTLTDPDASWPYGNEVTDTTSCRATQELAERLDVPAGVSLHREVAECMDPGGRSAMLVTSWWQGRRQPHASFVVEVGVGPVDEAEARSLGLLVDAAAYRLVRTRLDRDGRPVETADLVLPMDRWLIRLSGTT